MEEIQKTKEVLMARLQTLEEKRAILRAPELRALYGKIKDQPEEQRGAFGQAINELKQELEKRVGDSQTTNNEQRKSIDVTAPFDVNTKLPELLTTENGTTHPITKEIEKICDIFYRMGFEVSESREIDDEYHMFTSLNFPEGHPARDDYDTFMTE